MTAREMHYDFKQKLNKIDSQAFRNLIVPEIDWKLNEAQEIFVKIVAEPRLSSQYGFEVNQRTIDDIRTIVINQSFSRGTCLTPTVFDNSSYLIALPTDYWFRVKAKVYATKGNCVNKSLKAVLVQHDDEDEESPFDRSNFEWRICNYRFIKEGIRAFTDSTFTINKFCLDYLRKPQMIHNAQDYVGGTYNTLSGVALTGTQPCELPEMVHKEIVDLAVLIAAGDLSLPDIRNKENKIKLTQ